MKKAKHYQLLATLLALLALASQAQNLRRLNANSPGEQFEVKHYLDDRRLNCIVFFSPHCSASQALAAKLTQLAVKNPALNVGLLNIDRKEAHEIDWRSPLARQYNLRSLPYVYIIGTDKTTLTQGHEARKLILEMLDEAGL